MKIAQVAPLAEAVPPSLYGGTERVVSWLTEELVAEGHDVTLFATGDSRTSARLVPGAESGLRLQGIRDHTMYTMAMLDQVLRREDEFDIIHFHIDRLHFALFQGLEHKCLIDAAWPARPSRTIQPLFRAFPLMPLVSISDAQRKPIPPPRELARDRPSRPSARRPAPSTPAGAIISRSSAGSRPRSVRIAPSRSPSAPAFPLKIAAKVDKADQDYFDTEIKPLLDHPLIEFIGEIGEDRKNDFLGEGPCAPLPDRLARALRPRHDRGHVVRDARHRLAPTARSPRSSPTVSAASSSTRLRAPWRRSGLSRRWIEGRCAPTSRPRFTATNMAASYVAAYRRLLDGVSPRTLSLIAAE